jgi:hypothetical protein
VPGVESSETGIPPPLKKKIYPCACSTVFILLLRKFIATGETQPQAGPFLLPNQHLRRQVPELGEKRRAKLWSRIRVVSQIRVRPQLGREAIHGHPNFNCAQEFPFHQTLAGILQGQLSFK